jgi:hypothetical protein
MISYQKWKEEFDISQIMQMLGNSPKEPEQEQEQEPQLADFKGFINDRMAPRQDAAKASRLQSVSEFVGDLASFPKAKERIEYLNSHADIRDDIMTMNQSDWDQLESTLESMHPKDHQRMGHALRWLHMHMKSMGMKYSRKDNNLGQWAAKFRKSRSPKTG